MRELGVATAAIGIGGLVHYLFLLAREYGPGLLIGEEDRLLDLTRPEDKALIAAALKWGKVRFPHIDVKALILLHIPVAEQGDVSSLLDALEAAQAAEIKEMEQAQP